MTEINQFTRLYYDQIERDQKKVFSEYPLRYYVNPISKQFTHAHPSQFNIDTESELKISQPTRLNEIQRHNTEIFGTAPLTTRYDGPIQVENDLLHGQVSAFNACVKPSVEEYNYFDRLISHPNFIAGVPLPVDERISNTYISTRNDFRNVRLNKKI
jgi:hypothetical protein